MTWPSHDLTPEQTSRHQNTSLQSTKHHHHGRAEGSFTAKKWFGHRAGRSPCAHSIGKFFLCYIVLFLLETSAPGLSGHYWYRILYIRIYIYMRKITVACRLDMSPMSQGSLLWRVLQPKRFWSSWTTKSSKSKWPFIFTHVCASSRKIATITKWTSIAKGTTWEQQ